MTALEVRTSTTTRPLSFHDNDHCHFTAVSPLVHSTTTAHRGGEYLPTPSPTLTDQHPPKSTGCGCLITKVDESANRTANPTKAASMYCPIPTTWGDSPTRMDGDDCPYIFFLFTLSLQIRFVHICPLFLSRSHWPSNSCFVEFVLFKNPLCS